MKLQKLICKRCGFAWIPRIDDPSRCPNCHSSKWRTSRTGTEYGRKPNIIKQSQ